MNKQEWFQALQSPGKANDMASKITTTPPKIFGNKNNLAPPTPDIKLETQSTDTVPRKTYQELDIKYQNALTQNQSLTQQNSELMNKIRALEKVKNQAYKAGELEERLSAALEENSRLKDNASELTRKCEAYEKVLRDLQTDSKAAVFQKQAAALQAELEKTRSELISRTGEVQALKDRILIFNDETVKLKADVYRDVEDKIAQINRSKESIVDELKYTNNRSLAEIEDLKRRLEDDQRELAHLREANGKLTNARQDLSSYNEQLTLKIEQCQASLEEYKHKSSSLVLENDGFKEQLAQKGKENDTLLKKIRQLNETIAQVTKEDLEAKKAEIMKLEIQIEKNEKLHSDRIIGFIKENENLKNIIDDLKRSYGNIDSAVAATREENNKLLVAISNLEQEKTNLLTQNANISGLVRDLEDFKLKYNILGGEVDRLKIEVANRDNEIIKLNRKIDDYENASGLLRSRTKDLEGTAGRVMELEEQLRVANDELRRKTFENDTQKRSLADLETLRKENNEQRYLINQMKSQIEKLSSEGSNSGAENYILKESLKQKEAEIQTLKEHVKGLEETSTMFMSLSMRVKTLIEENNTLTSRLENQTNENKKLGAETKTYQTALVEKGLELDKVKGLLDRKNNEVLELNARCQVLEKEIKNGVVNVRSSYAEKK